MEEHEEQDPLDGLEARLQSHAKAFESLLALTPAREYFGSQIVDGRDPTDQWKRKKQTKEEKRAAKKAKLDPANNKSALDVLKEREAAAVKAKRKRDGDESDDDDVAGKQDVKRHKAANDGDAAEAKRRGKAERRKEKRQLKKDKAEAKKAKAEAKKERKLAEQADAADLQEDVAEDDGEDVEDSKDLEELDVSGLAEEQEGEDVDEMDDDNVSRASSAPTTPLIDSPAFDLATNHSRTSSSSSIIPPSVADQPKSKQSQPKPTIDTTATSTTPLQTTSKPADPPSGISSPKLILPNIDHEELQERVRKRIEELRAARKANGPDGKPAKTRQEMLDQRRKKEEQRKAAKKAQRQKAKEDEQRKRDDQLRGSGSPLSMDIFSPRSPATRDTPNSFSFSRLAFADGTAADPSLTTLHDPKKQKGPRDVKTALQAAQAKKSRIAGFDATKRADITEKDMWLHAGQRAAGQRVRDDTSLLKKALKRKEKGKEKSAKEWREREEGVVKGREMKQKKRERHLNQRKEEKGGKGGGKKKVGGGKKKARPGFEGSFRA